MVKRIVYIKFWDGFSHVNDILYQKKLNNSNYDVQTIFTGIDESIFETANVVICGSFYSDDYVKSLIAKYSYKIILFITEPIQINNTFLYELLRDNWFRAIIGCINNDINKIKYPLYNMYAGDSNNFGNFIDNSNRYIDSVTFDELCNKQFCWLINSHDSGNSRKCIYDALLGAGHITCPGKFLNNYNNEDFEKEGRESFQKRFIFGICPENYVTDLEGYVSEKLYFACIYGNIPIYYGKLDDIDKSIFNVNRILIYDPRDTESINNVANKVMELMSDKQMLFNFYKQHAFTENAIDVIINMENHFLNRTTEIIDSI